MEISVLSMIASAVLVLVCLFLVISPFFRNELNLFQPVTDLSAHENKAALMTTLNEIEFEHKMHKISDEDYKHLKKQYEVLLTDLMRKEDQTVQEAVNQDVLKEVEAEIEHELRKRQEEQGRK
jgi:hemoglobin-like flavoprotein